mgnify:FL=1
MKLARQTNELYTLKGVRDMARQKHNTKRITIRMPDELYEQTCRAAVEMGHASVSTFIRYMLDTIAKQRVESGGDTK